MSYPGAKQVWRFSQNGEYVGDEVTLQDDALRDAEPLLTCVMSNGRRVNPKVDLSFIRERAAQRLKKVPASVRRIDHPWHYPVTIGDDVGSLLEKCRRQVSNMQGGRNAA